MVGITIGTWADADQPERSAQFYSTDTPAPYPTEPYRRPSEQLGYPTATYGPVSALLAPDNVELDRIVSTHEARIDALETEVARP